VNIRI